MILFEGQMKLLQLRHLQLEKGLLLVNLMEDIFQGGIGNTVFAYSNLHNFLVSLDNETSKILLYFDYQQLSQAESLRKVLKRERLICYVTKEIL